MSVTQFIDTLLLILHLLQKVLNRASNIFLHVRSRIVFRNFCSCLLKGETVSTPLDKDGTHKMVKAHFNHIFFCVLPV